MLMLECVFKFVLTFRLSFLVQEMEIRKYKDKSQSIHLD